MQRPRVKRTTQQVEAPNGDLYLLRPSAGRDIHIAAPTEEDDRIASDTWARFDRQLRYFSDISTGPTASECQERLEGARVAVLGVGGLGGWSALALSCHGIGEMLLVDFDRVELNNLNRQVLYAEADIGRSKAQAAAERLGAFNSAMRIEVRDERLDSEAVVADAIEGADVVIDAVDWPPMTSSAGSTQPALAPASPSLR